MTDSPFAPSVLNWHDETHVRFADDWTLLISTCEVTGERIAYVHWTPGGMFGDDDVEPSRMDIAKADSIARDVANGRTVTMIDARS